MPEKTVSLITAVVRDRHGKVLSRERHEMRSFVRAWNHILCINGSPPGGVSTPDTGNVWRSLLAAPSNFQCNAGIGDVSTGIRVGTGNTPVDIAQYALIAPIAEGAGAGQMQHQGMTFSFIGVVGNVCSFELGRVIVNNSGGAINVAEAGIYCYAVENIPPGNPNRPFMGARDLITQNVPDGGAITITYTIRIVA